ncbi:hypothetical protein [Scytonema sp. UIC 10036]|nr:hypothetical protein [Scytonema sp. UIC 10036]
MATIKRSLMLLYMTTSLSITSKSEKIPRTVTGNIAFRLAIA